jgi:REP element-mobilizing transposase RayT
MPNTYTQLYIQFVFCVRGRQNLVHEQFRVEMEKVMCGIISNHNCKTYAIYANPDHTHIFVGMDPVVSPSKLMEEVKRSSTKWLNDKRYIRGKFSWQKGFGAFTYSRSHIDRVVKYVLNQPNHHKKQSFKDEYLLLLAKFGIDYDPKYLFEWYD